MIDRLSKEKCTGCMMCADLCPTGAIRFLDDEEGFWFPQVDKDKCRNCGLCLKKCPSYSEPPNGNEGFSPVCYGAWSKDVVIREESTSGGFFSELAAKWVAEYGLCGGAVYDEKFRVKHELCSDSEDIAALRQSKYVQSNTAGIFAKIQTVLHQQRKVLFVGTPCQVTALKSFLGKEYTDLVTIDFICCGISSPLVYRKYLEMLEKRYKSKVNKIWFKNKRNGWRSIGTYVQFENGKQYYRNGNRDLYMIAFVDDGLDMRQSCHCCRYRKVPHCSDIMLGDFWGIEYIHPELDDNKGISAVIINSTKGLKLFDKVKDRLYYFESTLQEIAVGNFTVYKPKEAHQKRHAFLEDLQNLSLDKAMEKYSSYSGLTRLKTDLFYYHQQVMKKIKVTFKFVVIGRK